MNGSENKGRGTARADFERSAMIDLLTALEYGSKKKKEHEITDLLIAQTLSQRTVCPSSQRPSSSFRASRRAFSKLWFRWPIREDGPGNL
jgi:hypothetical protein